MKEKIEDFLHQRSLREIFLFKLCFVIVCIFIAWESGVEQASRRYFLHAPQEEIPTPLPHLSYFEAQDLITKASNLINFSQSDATQENYMLETRGKIEDKKFFSLLNTLKNYPALKISAFSLNKSGEFSLILHGDNLQTYAPPSLILTPSSTLLSPWKSASTQNLHFVLEALLNQRAKINGIWIDLGEEISGYRLQDIQSDCVILKNHNEITLCFKEKTLQ